MGALIDVFDRLPPSWIRAAGWMRGSFPSLKAMTDWLPALLRNREGRIQRGLGRGLRFNGGDSAMGFVFGTHDPEVQFAIARLVQPGMTTYDIGANVGFTAMLAARRVGPTGRVVCFEPLPSAAAQIRHNAALNGFSFVDVHQVALARSHGEAEFLVSEESTWGRLLQAGHPPKESGSIRVPMRNLDSFAVSDHLPAPRFIKMDVEGVEADVIAGGKAFLATSRPTMVIELHHTYRAVVAALEGLDYVVRPLVPVEDTVLTDGECQIVAYPRECAEVESVLSELASGRTVFE